MAQLWKLPVVFVIENNQYAMGTSIERASSETHLYKRGISFNIPGEEVDGMDVQAVHDAGLKAAEHARSGNGPYILEMKTYAIAATPCPTPPSTGRARRSTRCARPAIPSITCASEWKSSA